MWKAEVYCACAKVRFDDREPFGVESTSAHVVQPLYGATETSQLTANGQATVVPIQPTQKAALSIHNLLDYVSPQLVFLFGKDRVQEVRSALLALVTQARQERPDALKHQDRLRASDWYKRIVIYSLYVDAFAAQDEHHPSNFEQLSEQLGYFKTLGVDTLHLLPFLESPMIDGGFDISNYEQVRTELGGNEAFNRFMHAAKQQDLFVMMDMVLNHVSEAHADFQAALNGCPEKLELFLHKETLPEFETLNLSGLGTVIQYRDGSQIRKILSDFEGCHFNESFINGKPRYFYSTFMPQQKDWNWLNPAVLLEQLRILSFWANQGIDIFRLDALPFLVKEPGSNGENTAGTHAVVQIISACLQVIAPSTILLAEAGVAPEELVRYYGQDRQVQLDSRRTMTRSDEVQMTYHFPLMSSIWASIVTQQAQPILETLRETPQIPESGSQITFVRVHDELSMESVKAEWQQSVHASLAPKGESCRNEVGVAGRVANFLESDLQRITLLYSILFSLPGTPLLYYGDDLMTLNNPMFMLHTAWARAQQLGISEEEVFRCLDKRDLNRGPLLAEVLKRSVTDAESVESKMLTILKRLIATKKQHEAFIKGALIPIFTSNDSVLSYLRQTRKERVLVIQNLSSEAQEINVKLPSSALAKKLTERAVRDLLTDQIMTLQAERNKKDIQLCLEPYQVLWLKTAE